MNDLKQEIATYKRQLPDLLGQQGKFVLIKGDEVAGTFESYQDAPTAGYQRFKLNSFLVKQITAVGRVSKHCKMKAPKYPRPPLGIFSSIPAPL
ncbi:hypothetical protein JM946_14075 [Steroidobacter sp. S1-65]|uniref:Uncharacterized protein n=1 Tax=Steroidobacter gossypii TaxID=2805490 RepID=A0ABS1WY19_9GAMM|nr:hypothetical protein [Steroidobacter gossypii]MBM0105863.1 hypothetical protein [Steroidobacter gossypii]